MSAKSQLLEEFIAMWREEQSLCDVMYPMYRGKNENVKVWKECQIKFIFFQTDVFE